MTTQYISDKFLNWLLDEVDVNQSLGLFTVMPDLNGLNYSEPTSADYQRAPVAPEDFETSSENLVENVNIIEFAGTTIGWGTVIGVGLFDSTNHLLWAVRAAVPLEVIANSRPRIGVGKVRFTISNGTAVVEAEPFPQKAARDSDLEQLVYVGRTEEPSLDTDPVWQIYRQDISNVSNPRIYANGTVGFVHQWSERETLTYGNN